MLPIDCLDNDVQEARQKRLDDLLTGYPVAAEHSHLMAGTASRLLPELAIELNAGLVVMGSIAKNALQRVFIGSTTEKVLDRLPCDLLVVKPLWFKCPVVEKSPQHFEGSALKPITQGNSLAQANTA